jgi:hypothetical protein
MYFATGHDYAQPKRERMYGWMERWLRGKSGDPVAEPPVEIFPAEVLNNLQADMQGNKGYAQISRLAVRYQVPGLEGPDEWKTYRQKMLGLLGELLGEPLPSRGQFTQIGIEEADGVTIERVLIPSEGGLLVPTVLLRPDAHSGRLPAVIVCGDGGKDAGLDDTVRELAKAGNLVVLPDVRFTGELSLQTMAGHIGRLVTFKPCSPLGEMAPAHFEGVWQRNGLVWGRPLSGMAATDLRAVLDYVAGKERNSDHITLRATGSVAFAALFAAALDDRIAALDIDLGGRCFEKRNAPLVPFVLRHGDVLQWAALLADRRLTLAGIPPEAGDVAWLENSFRVMGNQAGLTIAAP